MLAKKGKIKKNLMEVTAWQSGILMTISLEIPFSVIQRANLSGLSQLEMQWK